MATYRELHGKAVKTVTTNPSDDAAEGQIWFNSTDNTFKSIVALESFTSTSPLTTARYEVAGFGVQTANVAACGVIPPRTNVTEEYNGSGWTAGGNASQSAQYRTGFGTLTAGVIAGGRTPAPASTNATEEYDGSSYSGGGNLPTSIYLPGNQGAGTLTQGLVFAGDTGPGSSFPTASYEYDGSSWTAGGSINTARSYGAGSGSQTAAWFACGTTPPFSIDNASVAFEQYNGSSWTSGPNLNTARISTAGGGTSTQGLVYGGEVAGPARSSAAETWDGNSWSTSPATLATARLGSGRALGSGSGTANIVSGGYVGPPGSTGSCEEYNKSTNVITAAAFSSGGSLNTARYDIVGTGLQTAAVAAGGYSSSRVGATENYDGTSWTNSSTKPTAVFAGAMAGTQTASFYASGNSSPGGGRTASTEHYDGSNWTSGGNVNTARQQIGAQNGGTLTAGIIFAGNGGTTVTEHYDGTSWTTQPATVNDGRWNAIGTGDQTAAVMAGADSPATTNVEEYNGTAWSEVNNLPEIRYSGATIGTAQTDYIIAAGQAPGGLLTNSVRYDGTNWSTGPSNSTARTLLGGSSQQPTSAGVIYGGYTPGGNKSDTEEWNGETTALNVKTLTQS